MYRSAVLIVLVAIAATACAKLSPHVPRFVLIYEQRNATCLIQVIRDTRSTACFVAFQCGRHPTAVVNAASDVCVP